MIVEVLFENHVSEKVSSIKIIIIIIIIVPSSQVSLSDLKIKLNAMKNKDVISINLQERAA